VVVQCLQDSIRRAGNGLLLFGLVVVASGDDDDEGGGDAIIFAIIPCWKDVVEKTRNHLGLW